MFPTWTVNATMLQYTSSLTQPYQKLMTSYIFAEQYWFSERDKYLFILSIHRFPKISGSRRQCWQ